MTLPERGTIRTIGHPLCGREVALRRRRRQDDGGWFEVQGHLSELERDFAGAMLPFPANDPHGRGQHVLLYPEDIKP